MSSELSNSGGADARQLSEKIKAEAANLGFFACGIAEAGPVDAAVAERFRSWIACGGHAGMDYMARNVDKRLDPRLLADGVRSIVCVALAYAQRRRIPDGEYQFAEYAYGEDYHDVMKSKLRTLAAACGFGDGCRVFCDTAPVLERYWAVRAGLGWTGRNRQLIVPGAGSMFFLGELFLPVELDYDRPVSGRCGSCRACVEACPTGALSSCGGFDSGRCLSYQTIENRGVIPPSVSAAMGDFIYGCDRCQRACPWNRFGVYAAEPRLMPCLGLMEMRKADWRQLTADEYRRIFKGSAVKRVKYDGLMRNIRAAEAHGGTLEHGDGKP